MSQIQFNAAEVPVAADFTPVPAGEYAVILQSSEIKTNGPNKLIACGYRILDGDHKGSTIFGNINFLHSNETAQRIGQSELSSLCHAVSILQLTDTAQLHGRPLRLKVSQRKKDKDDPNSVVYNDIDAWLKADGSAVVNEKGAGPAVAAAPPDWAKPTTPANPQPAPMVNAPVAAAPVVTPAPIAATRYHVLHNGAVIKQNITADEVRALGIPLAELQLNVPGTPTWESAVSLAPTPANPPAPAPAAAPEGKPPWEQG